MFTFIGMKKYCFVVLLFYWFCADCQAQTIQLLQQDTASSVRGLSIVNDQVAWLSGSKGHVAISTNGGKTWTWQQVKGFEKSDFRDVEAFSAKEAIIMSSGTPALILKTIDAGANWKVVYRNDDKAYFLDAMDFADAKNGYVLGDPINQKFLLLETHDFGSSWKVMPNLPDALPNEAAFAASGTCLQVIKKRGNLVIVTGGSAARVLLSVKSKNWLTENVPVAYGQASQGAFSIAFGEHNVVVVGGDYQQNKKVDSTTCNYDSKYYDIKRKLNHYQPAGNIPSGFQSCVIYLDHQTFLSTGTSGSNISVDGGKTWKQIDQVSFNVCQKAKHGNLILLAGDKGKIARLINH